MVDFQGFIISTCLDSARPIVSAGVSFSYWMHLEFPKGRLKEQDHLGLKVSDFENAGFFDSSELRSAPPLSEHTDMSMGP